MELLRRLDEDRLYFAQLLRAILSFDHVPQGPNQSGKLARFEDAVPLCVSEREAVPQPVADVVGDVVRCPCIRQGIVGNRLRMFVAIYSRMCTDVYISSTLPHDELTNLLNDCRKVEIEQFDWCHTGHLFPICICGNKYTLQFNTIADEH